MLFQDLPIRDRNEDALNRGRFIDRLAQAIRDWGSQESLVIGIYGRWGEGKTSILRLLSESLSKECVVEFFDPWYFNSQEELIRNFLEQTIAAASRQLSWCNRIRMGALVSRLGKLVSSVPISLSYQGVSIGLADLKGKQAELVKLRTDLKRLLASRPSEASRKLVVMVDNLDRLAPSEIMLVLKLVRLGTDFSDLIFVLAFDRGHVTQAVEQELGPSGSGLGGQSFLDKIIHLDVHLPSIELEDIDEFVDKALDALVMPGRMDWPEEERGRFAQFYRAHLRGRVIGNLRDAKRYSNGLGFTLPLVAGEVNPTDWLITESVRIFAPEAYQLIALKIDLLCPALAGWGLRPEGAEASQWKAQLDRIAEVVGRSRNGFATAALELLFPVFRRRVVKRDPQLPSQAEMVEYSRRQLIASPEYRTAYLVFGPGARRVSHERMELFLREWHLPDVEGRATLVRKTLEELKENRQLKEFFDKLVLRPERFAQETRRDLAAVIAVNSGLLDKKAEVFADSEEDRAQALIFAVAQESSAVGDMQAILVSSVENAAEVSFAIDMVLFSTPERNKILRDFDGIDHDELKKALRLRLRRKLIEEGNDVFTSEPGSSAYILFQWSGPLLGEAKAVQEYLDRLFGVKPAYVGTFLGGFMALSPLDVDEAKRTLDMARLQEAFDPEWVRGWVERVSDTSGLDEEGIAAVRAFRERARHQNANGDD